ncbi:MAG: ATP-binding protein [Lachnospiraceae bacterium]|nr:ATP-binding protein [Lachnospiraceae bacterium]
MEQVLFDIQSFDKYKEDNRREVKAAEGGLPSSLWDTYSAMANTYGGVIICGVKERNDGSWFTTGMKDVNKLKKNFWNQANDQHKVSINLLDEERDFEVYEVNDDVILVIHVPVADRSNKPVFINGEMYKGSFKRTSEGDYHCTHDEVLASMEKGKWYRSSDLMAVLGLKETRTKELLRRLVNMGKLVDDGATKGKRYQLKDKR